MTRQYQPIPIYSQMMSDISVNKAKIPMLLNGQLMFITEISTNTAGNFNGGGTGNKCILGLQGFEGLDLEQMPSIDMTYQIYNSAPENADKLYWNAIMDMNGDGSLYKIMSFCSGSLGLGSGVETDLGDGKFRQQWNPSTDDFFIVLGNDLGITPNRDEGPNWTSKTYLASDVMEVYPDCRIVMALSGDGGMPKFVPTPALTIGMGDSANNVKRCTVLESLKMGAIQAI